MGEKKYILRVKDTWINDTQGLTPKERRIVDDKVLNHIQVEPTNSEFLHFDLEGLRSYRLPSGKRIVFALCNECRQRELQKANNCIDCSSNPDNTIMLFAFGEHDIYTKLGKKRKRLLKKVKTKQRKSRRN